MNAAAHMGRGWLEQYQLENFGSIQPLTVAYAASVAPDLSQSRIQQITLTGNVTLAAPVNPQAIGDELTLILIQDGTGSRTVSFNAAYKNAPSLSAGAASTRALLVFQYDGNHYQFRGGASAFS